MKVLIIPIIIVKAIFHIEVREIDEYLYEIQIYFLLMTLTHLDTFILSAFPLYLSSSIWHALLISKPSTSKIDLENMISIYWTKQTFVEI